MNADIAATPSSARREPEHTHLMLGSKPSWVPISKSESDHSFDEYPTESIAAWLERLGLNE